MGHLFSDGKAIDVVAPAATAIAFGDLYRIDLWSGISMDTIGASDTARGMALEVSERIWKVLLPGGLTPTVGQFLYWTAGTGFKRGDTDLAAAVNGAPVCKVLVAKNANGYAAVKVFQDAAVA